MPDPASAHVRGSIGDVADFDRGPVEVLLDRHRRHEEPFDVEVATVRLRMLPEVFCPAYTKTSVLLTEVADIAPGQHVLDMFCGSGFLGIIAARRGAEVLSVDRCEQAVRCAEGNARLNGVEDRLAAVQGNLFEPVDGRSFDFVLANPPLLPGVPASDLEATVFDPQLGVSRRFVEGVSGVLRPGGRAYLMVSSVLEHLAPFDPHDLAAAHDLEADVVVRHDVGYEVYSVYELTKVG